jgi:hypothetical protein
MAHFKLYPNKKHCALHLSVSKNMFKSTDTCILNNGGYFQHVWEYIHVLYPVRYKIQCFLFEYGFNRSPWVNITFLYGCVDLARRQTRKMILTRLNAVSKCFLFRYFYMNKAAVLMAALIYYGNSGYSPDVMLWLSASSYSSQPSEWLLTTM